MKKTKLKKIAGSIAVCGLCIATAVFGTLAVTTGNLASVKGKQSFANGFVTIDSEGYDKEYKVGITRLDEDFFSPYDNNNKVGYKNPPAETLIPGSERSGSITFQNNSTTPGANIGIFFWAESTPLVRDKDAGYEPDDPYYGEKPYELYKEQNPAATYDADTLKKASDLLVSDYMTLKVYDDEDKLVYDGSVAGMGNVLIGTLHPGESKKFTFKVKIPAKEVESFARDDSPEEAAGLDHGYDNTVAMIDWHFGLSYVAAPVRSTTSTTTTTTTTKAPPPPNTGEAPNMYLFAAIACGVSALVMFYVTFYGGQRKRKEEED